jgi:hypothetical protein
MNFSDQRYVYRNLRLNSVNLPKLIGGLVDDQFTGYAVLTTNDRDLKLMFDFGGFLGAALDGKPVPAGGEAKAVLPFHEDGALIDIVELPSRLVQIMWGIFFGTNLTGELPTELVDLEGLTSKYDGKVASGALVLYQKGSPSAVMSVEDGERQFVTSEEEFRQLYDEEGTTLALFSFDNAHQAGPAAALKNFFKTLEKSDNDVREALIRKVKEYYPQDVQTLVALVEREFKGPQDLEPVLEKVEEYIRLFVDSGITHGFITDLRETAAREIKTE